ncbi:MCE family protein [Amycolatopsis suaedae]|uniref:MCE family protein n=1 Tax=Amycolatopsis suaedae TaxID=2510978 RepID=A0A4Q7JGC2_9PSEU|nr:MCE family protein [Amycolatopsis suaedae]RZQ65814.1 MCE family protein [Amycolatopsis suaedae]
MRRMLGPMLKGLVFTVVTGLATILLGLAIMSGGGGGATGTAYVARFTDVTSLNPGDDVRMAGVRVGSVVEVRVADRRVAEVEFALDGDRRIPATTTATIKFRNLVGQRYIALDSDPGVPAGLLPPGGLIPLERTRPALDLTAMLNGFKPLFRALNPDQVNALAQQVVQVLQGEGGTVESLVRHTASLTSTLADRDRVIGQVIINLDTVLSDVAARDERLSGLVGTTQELVSGLARDAGPIGEAISGLSALTTSTADLLGRGRQPLKADIAALGELATTLADNTPVFEEFIRALPLKYEAIGRVASYGGWTNLFLCLASSDAPPAPGGPPVGIPLTEARCLR